MYHAPTNPTADTYDSTDFAHDQDYALDQADLAPTYANPGETDINEDAAPKRPIARNAAIGGAIGGIAALALPLLVVASPILGILALAFFLTGPGLVMFVIENHASLPMWGSVVLTIVGIGLTGIAAAATFALIAAIRAIFIRVFG